MRSILYAVFALGLVACADSGPGKVAPPWGDMASADMSAHVDMPDTEDMATPQDMTPPVDMAPDMPEPDEGPDCTCTGETECCDGCDPINAGDACDDGLECTLGTTCQDDGTCAAATNSPCDTQLEHPDCQIAMCDEVAGCSSMPAREGFECDDKDPQTVDDICIAGKCSGTPCECSEADGPCCDGCFFLPAGTVCEEGSGSLFCSKPSCPDGGCSDRCGARPTEDRDARLCTGDSASCDGDWQRVRRYLGPQCADNLICYPSRFPEQNPLCSESDSCN